MNNTIKVLLPSLLLASHTCFASFLSVDQQSVSAMGNAFAGAASAGDDASISFYNPAGLMLIEEGQVVGAITYAIPDSTLTINSAFDSAGNPIPNTSGQEISSGIPSTPIPALHIAKPITEDMVLGMSITAPYWIVTDYGNTPVKYNGIQSKLYSYNGNLSLAKQMTEELSVGLGVNAMYFTHEVNFAIGTITDPQGEQAFTEYSGDSLAFYPNVGLLYEWSDDTRMGLAYVFPVDQNTDGYLTTSSTAVNAPSFEPAAANSNFLLPDYATLSFFHQATPKIELLADLIFTHWGRWDDYVISAQLGTPIESDIPLDLENTWRLALGANYQYNPTVKLRAGIAYDQSPITDETRTLQSPDSDRVDASIGISIAPKNWDDLMRIDLAYMHSFFANSSLSQQNLLLTLFPGTPVPATHLTGSYETSADFVGAQIVYLM